MVKIARAKKDTELRDAAIEFTKATKTSAQQLADELATFAVQIAGAGSRGSSGRSSSRSRTATSRAGTSTRKRRS